MGSEAKELYAFLLSLRENPADHETRLVFADWLDEHDEPELAAVYRKEAEYITFDRKEAEDWMRDFCKRYGADYDELLASVAAGEGYCFSDDDGPEAARYDPDFRKCMRILLGRTDVADDQEFTEQRFRCAC